MTFATSSLWFACCNNKCLSRIDRIGTGYLKTNYETRIEREADRARRGIVPSCHHPSQWPQSLHPLHSILKEHVWHLRTK